MANQTALTISKVSHFKNRY